MSLNCRKIGSGDFELLPFLSLNDPTDKNAFGQFGWFSRVGLLESLSYTLSTRFKPLYINMYYIGPSDGAVSHYAPRLEIDGATSA